MYSLKRCRGVWFDQCVLSMLTASMIFLYQSLISKSLLLLTVSFSPVALQVIDGKLAPFLSKVIKFASSHVFSCSLCREKGFICELCHNGQVIYPFQESATRRYKESDRTVQYIDRNTTTIHDCDIKTSTFYDLLLEINEHYRRRVFICQHTNFSCV